MSHLWAHSPDTVVFFWLCVYLSEYVAGKGLIEPRLHVYKLKKVQTISVFLHHHLKVTPILKHLQHLVTPTQVYDVKQHSSRLKHIILETFATGSCDVNRTATLTMLWCVTRVSMAISWLTRPNIGSSTQQSLTILALLMNFTITCRFLK